MGIELLVAMVMAAAVTHSMENAGRQAKSRWDQSREDARRSAEARQESRRQRADQVRDRFGRAQSTGPRDPLWWPYAAGWAAAGTAAAAGAGVVGLVRGAKAGARSGYRVGKQGADRGWNLRDTWTQWRTENPREPLDLEECERCGGWAAELHSTMDHGLVCDDCLPRDTGDTEQDPEQRELVDERLRERQMRCDWCSALTRIADLDNDLWCPSCRDAFALAKDENRTEAPREDAPAMLRFHADRVDMEETEQKENPEMNALPTGSAVAVTGEGYTDTIQSLQALAKEMQDAQNAATDLGDSLTANSLDSDTLQQIADLTDQVETVANLAEQLHRHVEQRHNPLAEATAAAGGSGNVASKTWYDQY